MVTSAPLVNDIAARFLLSPQDVIDSVRSLVVLRRTLAILASAAFALALNPRSARAQTPLGALDDATVLRAGMLRIDATFLVSRANERFGLNTPGLRAGSPEPLAIDFGVGDVGVAQFPGLTASEQGIRSASGLSSFVLSLGRPAITSEISSASVPIRLDVGVTSRLMIGVMVPYVRTRNDVRADFNPSRTEGNAGINPALVPGVARTTNTAFRNQVTSAAAALRAALDACAVNPGSGNCPNLEANRATAEALIVESRGFRDQVETIYGSDTADAPALFIPRANSAAQSAIDLRATTFNALYRSLLGLSSGSADPIAARPFPAQTPLAAGQAQTLFTDPDSRLGVVTRPPQTTERSHLGDIEVGARLLLFDSFANGASRRLAFRTAVGAVFRFATGQEDDPDDLFDVPTGDGQNDVELSTAIDVGIARRVTTTVRGRYTLQLPDQTMARITDVPSDVFAPAYRRQSVERDLGDIVEIDIVPRFAPSEYFALVGQYLFRRKGEDVYTGRFTIPGETTGIGDVELDAATLAQETRATEQRIGWGFTFSLNPAARTGRVRRPIEVSYLHSRSVRGSGGNQPKWVMDALQVRIATRFLGR